LGGVTVTLTAPSSPSFGAQTITATDGTYSFTGLKGASYVVSFALNGYQSETDNVTIADGATVTQNASLVPPPPPSATVFIYVFDSTTQNFLEGGSVSIQLIDGRTFGPQLTDSSGLTYFPDMPSGIAGTIIVNGPYGESQYSQSGFVGGDNIVQIIYPGGDGGTPPPAPTSNVTITVRDPHNVPVANGTVTVTYSNGAPSVTATTDASGQVTFASQPAGVSATISVTHAYGNGTSTQTFSQGTYAAVVHITPVFTRVTVHVISGDGSGPAMFAFVTLGSLVGQADFSGDVVFDMVPVGMTSISAISQDGSKVGVDVFNFVGITDDIFIQVF
jgi:hypothetical protein